MFTAVFINGGVEREQRQDKSLTNLTKTVKLLSNEHDDELVCVFKGTKKEPIGELFMTYDRCGTLSPRYERETWVTSPKTKRRQTKARRGRK